MGNIFVKEPGISDNISVLFFFCHCAAKICHQKEHLLFLICDKMHCTIDQKKKEKRKKYCPLPEGQVPLQWVHSPCALQWVRSTLFQLPHNLNVPCHKNGQLLSATLQLACDPFVLEVSEHSRSNKQASFQSYTPQEQTSAWALVVPNDG